MSTDQLFELFGLFKIENRKFLLFLHNTKKNFMLKGILAISGQPGLFKVLSEVKSGVIVESLISGKKQTVFASSKMSTLEDIAIYTTSEDFPLKEVFRKIFDLEKGGQSCHPNTKPEELKQYFETVLPDFDKERVYVSDIKKVISWYNLLQEKGLLDFEPNDSNPDETLQSEVSL